MNIRAVRRISQVFFVALFAWFCVVTVLGERWWQLRGWPVNWLLQLDPLVALGTLLTTGAIYKGLLWALVTVVLTILLGRFFCGWVCPFGTLHQFVGWLGRRRMKLTERVAVNQYHNAQVVKYYLLVFLLTAAAGSVIAKLIHAAHEQAWLPWLLLAVGLIIVAALATMQLVRDAKRATVTLLVCVGSWAGLALVFPVGQLLATSLQTGLLDPIPLLHRSVNLVVLPVVDAVSATRRAYEGAWLVGAIFLAAVLLNFVVPRFYCRFVCPLGALLGVLARWAVWRIGKVNNECSECTLCEDNCEGACQPFEKIRWSECVLCMNCLDPCKQVQVSYRTAPSAAGEITGPDLTRRGFLISAASGLAAAPMLRLSSVLGSNWRPNVIRPPGALAEKEFLDRCVKCGQCMRVCPTNIIQPATLEAGLEGLWTPQLNFRIGTSGCQLNCVACGHICPTAAIRPFSLDEKLGRGKFAETGPIRMGTAFVDRGRCLPWAMDKPCIVCEENCPVRPKAIFLRDEFVPIRDGVHAVRNADAVAIELETNRLRAGELATGDYYCKLIGAPDEQRRRITQNTANSITIESEHPWDSPLRAGSEIEIAVRLQKPFVDTRYCTGCGICEHECPVSGLRAIRVTAENESRSAKHALVLDTRGRLQ